MLLSKATYNKYICQKKQYITVCTVRMFIEPSNNNANNKRFCARTDIVGLFYSLICVYGSFLRTVTNRTTSGGQARGPEGPRGEGLRPCAPELPLILTVTNLHHTANSKNQNDVCSGSFMSILCF